MGGPAVLAQEQQGIHRFLCAGEWFGRLHAPLQQLILDRSAVRKFAKGQVISLEGSVTKGLYAVLEGHVHIVRDIGGGDEALIHAGEPGFWFGEYALMTGRPAVATTLAHTPVRALFLPNMQFHRIVAEEPRYYEAFARLALDRYGILVRLYAELRDLTPESRLRGRLAVMVQMRQQERREPGPVSLAFSQADLARIVGVSRQTLNAILGKLTQAGLIEVGFRRICVLDAARLADPDAAGELAERQAKDVRRRVAPGRERVSGEHID